MPLTQKDLDLVDWNGRATGANNALVLTIQNQLKVLKIGFKSIWADNTLQIKWC